MKEPYLHALYCDDIRQEFDGKISLIGIYSNIAALASYPAQIPKFGISGWLMIPKEIAPQSIRIVVKLDDQEISRSEPIVAPEIPDKMPGLIYSESKEANRGSFLALNMILAPLNVEKPSTLRILAEVDGQTVEGPGLNFVAIISSALEPNAIVSPP